MKRHGQEDAGLRISAWKIVIFGYVCLTPMAVLAQTEKPAVTVSLYFASEDTVCPPDGYGVVINEVKRKCRKLDFEDIEEMESQDLVEPVQRSIPPAQVRLGKTLFDSIDAFRRDCPRSTPCRDFSRRYAMILSFEVNTTSLRNGDIEIRRVPPPDSKIEEISWKGKLSPLGRWINHQRADTFVPAYRFRWILQIDEWTWRLGTQP